MSIISANLAVALSVCFVGMASPGPSNLAIMGASMNLGRAKAMFFAAGVVTGSVTWGLLAAFGLSAVLATWSRGLLVLRVVGGLYLLWLAFKAGRSAVALKEAPTARAEATDGLRLFLRGAAMHLTNPKAVLVWLAIVSMALPDGARTAEALAVVGACSMVAVAVFGSYALLFSTASARRVYRSSSRWFEGLMAVGFGYAGIRMFLAK